MTQNFQEKSYTKDQRDFHQESLLALYQGTGVSGLLKNSPNRPLTAEEQIQKVLSEERAKINEERKQIQHRVSELARVSESLNHLASQMQKEKEEWMAHLQKEINTLIVLLAEKIVSHELKTNNELIQEFINKVVFVIKAEVGQKNLFLSQDDLQIIREELPEVIQNLNKIENLEILEDSHLKKGEVRAETSSLKAEASLVRKLNNFWEELINRGVVNERPSLKVEALPADLQIETSSENVSNQTKESDIKEESKNPDDGEINK